ncbi:hypothetical protein Gbem_4106 [Citrifermentans bemidjiense Bem]|uniref:Uncharacterized protein n=1 Tax=Citrifermentans bemidjiense (strain ATCC BAA-1014 / DSM 16622 / JCM 12645 / Bem) TaxID=404380 RepID=E1P6B0_CITBB|nr:hypothetical protein Gbem_4106 [Citrifermentans bemidjiense Bem]
MSLRGVGATSHEMEIYVLWWLQKNPCDRKRKKALRIVYDRMVGKSRLLHPSCRRVLKIRSWYL